jgi:peptidoglycan hydrolase-like protein with peptidoglycan-binding domain
MRAARVNDQNISISGRHAVRLAFPVRWLLRRPRDSMAGAVAGVGAIAILVNALFMQSGPHPAPIFANKPVPVTAPLMGPVVSLMPQGRVGEAKTDLTSNRPRSDMIADIQRQLTRRGFYDGPADGVYGPKTDTAIRDFEQAAGLRPSAEPNDVLLATISKSSVKAHPTAVPRSDPIAALLAPSPRILAVQRALTDFGYGPVKPSGVYDVETRAAVERFEKARRRPVTGQISDQLVRDLAALTGRPLE